MKHLLNILKILINTGSFACLGILWWIIVNNLWLLFTEKHYCLLKGDCFDKQVAIVFFTFLVPVFLFGSWKVLKNIFSLVSFKKQFFLFIMAFLLMFTYPTLILLYFYSFF